jgi:hypothetical protein
VRRKPLNSSHSIHSPNPSSPRKEPAPASMEKNTLMNGLKNSTVNKKKSFNSTDIKVTNEDLKPPPTGPSPLSADPTPSTGPTPSQTPFSGLTPSLIPPTGMTLPPTPPIPTSLKTQRDTTLANAETLLSVQKDANDEIVPTGLPITADDNNTIGTVDINDNDVKKNSNTVVGLLSIDSPYSLIREIFAS